VLWLPEFGSLDHLSELDFSGCNAFERFPSQWSIQEIMTFDIECTCEGVDFGYASEGLACVVGTNFPVDKTVTRGAFLLTNGCIERAFFVIVDGFKRPGC
jgi:hypothetical protein